MLAAYQGHIDIVQLLIANGADANAKRNEGNRVLDAATAGKHDDICALLIRAFLVMV
jgi:ankyrin repeat protein